ncbi:hypothetical protein [Bacillus sp. AK128]
MDWRQIRSMGKRRFVILSGVVLSIPLVLDYLLIKFLVSTFTIKITLIELLLVWIGCMLIGTLFSFFSWNKMEEGYFFKN